PILRAKAIGHPRAKAGPSAPAEAGVQEHLGRAVVDLVRAQRFDEREFIRRRCQVWQQFRDLLAALSVPRKLETGAGQGQLLPEESETLALGQFLGTGLTIMAEQCRLMLEQVELGGGADHVQINDMLRPRREVRLL